MSGFGSLKPKSGNTDSLRLNEVIEMHTWPADEWSVVRFIPSTLIAVRRHWIKIYAGKEKKEISIPRYCLTLNPLNESEPRRDEKGAEIKCPYCDITHGNDGSARYEFFYLANAIIRELQEDEPRKKHPPTKTEKKTGFKDIRSKSWTPVRVCRIPSSVAIRMQELSEGNTVKSKSKKGKLEKTAFDITHEKYGIDVRVKFKPKASGTEKYSADKDERTPLTDEEKSYLIWELNDNLLDVTGRMSVKQATEDFKRMDIVGGDVADGAHGIDLGDDDDDDSFVGKKKKSTGKKKRSAFDDDDEPVRKKKKPAFDDDDDTPVRKKKKPAFDDDDDEPVRKKKKSSTTSKTKPVKSTGKKKKPAFDDDDDTPVRKKKKSSTTSKTKPVKSTGKKKKSKPDPWDDDE